MLTRPLFPQTLRGIRHAFTDALSPEGRSRFSLSLNGAYPHEEVLRNREALSRYLKTPLDRFVFMQQEHTARIAWVDESMAGRGWASQEDGIEETDAIYTQCPGVALVAQTGDCQPILLYDPVSRAIAAIHSGWKGTVQAIAARTLHEMETHLGVKPKNVHAALGPCIGTRAFEVGEEVAEAFRHLPVKGVIQPHPTPGKARVDIGSANRQLLELAGVPPGQIYTSPDCTYEQHPQYFSARRGDRGRQVGVIVLV